MGRFTDDFNRGNNTDIGASWTVTLGGNTAQIIGSKVRSNVGAAAGSAEYVNIGGFSNDQFARDTLTFNNSNDSYGGVIVRAQTAADSRYTLDANKGTGVWSLNKFVTGSWSPITSGGTAPVTGDLLTLTVTGSGASQSILGYQNANQVVTSSDNAIASGNPGIVVGWNTGGANGDVELDDFYGGDLPILVALSASLTDDWAS